jgi:Rrf2 family protein
MQLSKGFDYAIRSLVYLALLPKGTSAELRSISESQVVPVSYLAKVMRNLVRGGLVSSTLGRDGGYALRKRPAEITLMQIYEIMEGEMILVECMDDENSCVFFGGCPQASVWRRLRETVEHIFVETSLQDLLPAPAQINKDDRSSKNLKEKSYARAGA